MRETWISVFDGNECDSCHELHLETEEENYWNVTGRPGERPTICVLAGHACRCVLTPDIELDELVQERDRLLEEAIDGVFQDPAIKVDIGVGGRAVNLKHYEQIEGMLTLPFSTIEKYENMIWTWKLSHPKIKYLPDEFYQLADIKKQMSWLRRELKALGITKIQDTRGLGG